MNAEELLAVGHAVLGVVEDNRAGFEHEGVARRRPACQRVELLALRLVFGGQGVQRLLLDDLHVGRLQAALRGMTNCVMYCSGVTAA